MLVKRIAACIPIGPYLQPFPSNSTSKFKSSWFSTFFAHFGLPWVRPWDNRIRSKYYMDGKRIQCWSNASQHIPIYLQPFTIYSVKLQLFPTPLHLTPPLWMFPSHWNSGKKFGPQKTRIMRLPGNEDNLTSWAASTQYQRVTDRQTYVQPIAITCAVWLSDWRTLKTLIPAGRDYIPGPQLLILLYCVDAIFVLPVDPAWGLRPCLLPLSLTQFPFPLPRGGLD